MQVPFIDLSRTVSKVKDLVLADWREGLERCEFVGGPSCQLLERRMEEQIPVSHFVGASNGTSALSVALAAQGIGSGMRVALPNVTFWASYEAIATAGAEAVLIDIDPHDLQIEFEEFKEAYERFRFDAAMLVHLYGWTSKNLNEIRSFCRKKDIILIEDGAQCFGAELDGQGVLSQADVGTFSFYPAKVLGASGDAGGITCQNVKLAEKVRSLINHGRAGHYTHDYVGYNARLGGMQAKFLLRMLDIFPELLASRRKAEAFYQEFFREHEELCKVYQAPTAVTSNAYLNVMVVHGKTGDEVVSALARRGIGAARTYPQTICQQPPARKALRASDLSKSLALSKNVVNLPLFAGITELECQKASEACLKIMRGEG